jgi:hypothetical protein
MSRPVKDVLKAAGVSAADSPATIGEAIARALGVSTVAA